MGGLGNFLKSTAVNWGHNQDLNTDLATSPPRIADVKTGNSEPTPSPDARVTALQVRGGWPWGGRGAPLSPPFEPPPHGVAFWTSEHCF